MATVARTRFASPSVRALVGGRLAELAGLLLALCGVLLLIALASYNPHDPSLNTATSRAATNLAGSAGAAMADLLLQGFGLAGVLPGLALLAWGWRVGSKRGLGSAAWRIGSIVLALPVAAAALGVLPLPLPGWPTSAGPAGAAGLTLGPRVQEVGAHWMGPAGALVADSLLAVLALALAVAGLGLSLGEWRLFGRGAAPAARYGYRGGRGTAAVVGRVML